MDTNSSQVDESRGPSAPIQRRRTWTTREENTLIIALGKIIESGWKCENGFKNGYLNALEKEMRLILPNCDIRSDPHIASKIHAWKKNQACLQTMLATSGFSWDNETHQIIVEDENVWEEYAKHDDWGRKMRNKSYPLYSKWCELFGKDRARGECAEDFNVAEKTQLEEGGDEGDEDVPMNSPNMAHNVNTDESPTAQSAASGSSKGKRRKRNADQTSGEQIVNLMGKFCETTGERLGEIAQNIGYEFKMSQKREKIREELGKVQGLYAENRIAVAKVLMHSDKDLELFFSLPPDEKVVMVNMVMSGRI